MITLMSRVSFCDAFELIAFDQNSQRQNLSRNPHRDLSVVVELDEPEMEQREEDGEDELPDHDDQKVDLRKFTK